MAKIRCEKLSEGLRQSEVVASFIDFKGRTHFIRVERDFLSLDNGDSFLPVGIVHVDPKSNAVLIELPHESERRSTGREVHGRDADLSTYL